MGGVLTLVKKQSQDKNSCSIACSLGFNEIANTKVISKRAYSTRIIKFTL